MSKRRTRRPRQGRGRGHVNRDGLDTRLGARYVPTPAVPRPPDPRRTREYTYFGPRVAGGTFSPATKTSRGGPGAGHSDYRWDTAARRPPTARPYLGRFRILDKSIESRVRDAVRTEGGPFFRGRGGRGGSLRLSPLHNLCACRHHLFLHHALTPVPRPHSRVLYASPLILDCYVHVPPPTHIKVGRPA